MRRKSGRLRISVRALSADSWRTSEMCTSGSMSRVTLVAALTLLMTCLTRTAAAQDRPRPAVEFSAGWTGFADDGIVSEGIVGGTGRWYLSPRVAVGPEAIFFQGQNHNHFALTGNVTFDLLSP